MPKKPTIIDFIKIYQKLRKDAPMDIAVMAQKFFQSSFDNGGFTVRKNAEYALRVK